MSFIELIAVASAGFVAGFWTNARLVPAIQDHWLSLWRRRSRGQ